MRALVLILALTVACAAAALADMESPGYASPPASGAGPTTTMTSQEEMADACIASSIGITREQVHQLRSQGLTYADIAMAQAISMKACKPLTEVVDSWKQCKSWPDTAKKYNLSMSDIMRWPMMGNPDTEAFNSTFISQYFGIAQSDIEQLRKDGFTWDEIYLIANASARTGQPASQIASLRSQGMSWSDIAAKYNTTLSDLICPVPAKRVATATSGAGPACFPPLIYTSTGNILLNADMVNNLYDKGYDWLDVAISANMARATGVPVQWFLDQARGGRLWLDIIYEFNVSPRVALNVADYPFERRSIYSRETDCARLAMIERFQKPGETYACPQWPVMAGRMPTASPSY